MGSSPRRSFWHLKSRVWRVWPGRLVNVRLAALDLREISGLDLEGSGLYPGILGFRVSPKFTCSYFLLNVTFQWKLDRLQCRSRVTTSIT